ncbi:MAG: GAF domain-containing protein [bacterium]
MSPDKAASQPSFELFRNNPLPIYVFDLDTLQILDVNAAAVAAYGYSRDEFLAMRTSDIRPPEDVPKPLEDAARDQPGLQYVGEWRHRRKSGEIFDVRVSSHIEQIAGRRVALVIVQDLSEVTERKRVEEALRQSERRFRALVENASDGIVLIRADRTVVYASPSVARMLGYSPDEIVGRKSLSFYHPDDAVRLAQFNAHLLGRPGNHIAAELRLRHKDGSWRWVETVSTNLLHDPDVSAVVSNFREITDRRQADETIRRRAVDLEALHDIAGALRQARALDEMYRTLVERSMAVFGAIHGSLALLTGDRTMFTRVYTTGIAAEVTGSTFPVAGTRSGRVVQSNESFVTGQFGGQELPEFMDPAHYQTLGPFALVPVRSEEEVLGTLVVARPGADSRPFTDADVRLLETIAETAGTAIRRARLYDDLQQRLKILTALYDGAQRLTETLDLRQIARDAARTAVESFGARLAWLGSLDPGGPIEVLGHYPEKTEYPRQVAAALHASPLARGRVDEAIHTGTAYVIDDLSRHPGSPPRQDVALPIGLRCAAGFPLVTRTKTFGLLAMYSDRVGFFNGDRVTFFQAYANQVGAALETARLYQEATRRAEEFESLYETARDLATHPDVHALLQTIVERATGLLHAHGGTLSIHDAQRHDLEVAVAKNAPVPAGSRVGLGEGFRGRVASTREPLRIDDFGSWEHRLARSEGLPLGPLLGVPLLYGGELVGVLDVHEPAGSPRRFTDGDARLLSLFAGQAAAALHNARLFAETEERLRQVQSLHDIEVATSNNFDLRITLQIVLGKVTEHLGVDAADVLLLREPSQMLEPAASRGFRTDGLRQLPVRLGDNVASQVVLNRAPVVIADLAAASKFSRVQLAKDEGFVTYAAVPLIAKGEVRGILEVFHRQPLAFGEAWMDFLNVLAGQTAVAVENATLITDLRRVNNDLTLAYDRTIEGWSRALDLRDKETEGHAQRVTEMAVRLARALGMPEGEIVHLRRGALLHDIGKMGVPDRILLKPGPLTEEEWVLMRRHPLFAYELLSPVEYLRLALDIPYCHHEKWDGTGYPRGLKEQQIPLAARIFAGVDVWDALRSDRPYRPAWSEAKTRDYIRSQSGAQFDPRVVEALLNETRPAS